MTKKISFNAFEMNSIAHQSPGLWRHPQDRSVEYKDLEYWTDLAQILERGFFDGIFIADVLGIYDVYHQSAEHALTGAVQVPVNDPLQIVPAMAAVTKHLGFGVTTSISFEHPYPFARRISTLDHLTKGRVGWNIVTSYLESGSKNLGLKTQVNHDNRYDIADEYLEVLYKLWEGSWEEGSVLRDRESGIFADHKKCIQFSTRVNTLLYQASIFVNHHHSAHQYSTKQARLHAGRSLLAKMPSAYSSQRRLKLPLKKWYRVFAKNWLKKAAIRTQLKFMHFCRLSLMKPMQKHRLSLKNIKAMEATMGL